MKSIQLNSRMGKINFTLVDDDIYDIYAGGVLFMNDSGYALTKIEGKNFRLHRLIMNAPAGIVVDHLNGNRLDNRRNNLRITTQKANSQNRKDTRGYAWDKSRNKWLVRYRYIFYGRYDTEEEAKAAYQRACSGVPYKIGELQHKRRKYLPKGVFYMKSMSMVGSPPYYIRPQRNGMKYFQGYFSTVQEAETAYNKFLNKEK